MKDLKAKELMTPDPMVVGADWSIERLTEALLSRSVSGAPVVTDRGKLLGVVSLTDVTRSGSLAQGAIDTDRGNSEHVHDYYQQALERRFGKEEAAGMSVAGEPEVTVGDIMTPMVFEVSEDALVREIAEVMTNGRIHRVFVTKGGELVGVISALDMVKLLREA